MDFIFNILENNPTLGITITCIILAYLSYYLITKLNSIEKVIKKSSEVITETKICNQTLLDFIKDKTHGINTDNILIIEKIENILDDLTEIKKMIILNGKNLHNK